MVRRLLPCLLLLAACAASKPPAPAPAAPAAPPAPPPGIDLSMLDPQVDACTDFYQHACGAWLAKTEIPADRPTWTHGFSEVQERNQLVLQELLVAAAEGKAPEGTVDAAKLGAAWTACMDEAGVEAAGLKPLQGHFDAIDKLKDAKGIGAALATLRFGGVSAGFTISVVQDFKDATQVIAQVDQGGMGLPDRDYYVKDDEKSVGIRAKYLEHVAKMLELSGQKPEAAKANAAMVMKFETALAKAALTRTERRDPERVYHRLEVAGLTKLAPKLPWAAMFKQWGFASLTQVNVTEPAFFQGLDLQVGKTPIAEWKAYLRWQVLHAAASELGKAFVDEDFRFRSEALTGAKALLPRWKRCVAMVDDALGFSLAQAFVAKTYGQDGKAKTVEMIKSIEKAFETKLPTYAWMDDTTRTPAKAKLDTLANKVGYPDVWQKYDGLEMNKATHLQNALNSGSFEFVRQLTKVGRPLDRTEWLMTPPTVNAYYDPSMNEMVFPAGILQPPFFDRSATDAVNYGAIGMVMGHELTHGFDDEGRRFDAKGSLTDWWSAGSTKAFEEKSSCVARQYDGYVAVDDLHLNGKLTLGENLADLGGLRLAFQAMKAAGTHKSYGAVTPEKQFFYGYAQSWCQKSREAYSRMLVTVDPHSPARFRVIGPLSNMKEFAEAFGCKAGAPMVRAETDRCEVW